MTFGKEMQSLWPLEPEAIYLNHGTVGVAPRAVLEAQQRWRDRIERHPARFLLRELWTFAEPGKDNPTVLRRAASAVAEFVGARAQDLVFVDNTTTGVNGVMRSLPLKPGDEVVVNDHAYGGVVAAVQYAADRAGATVRTVSVPYPEFDADLLVKRFGEALNSKTKLVLTDHIAAESALIFPVERIVRLCREHKVPVLVDGAHVPGALPLNVSEIGADFYVANLHKWAMAPRSSAFMAVAPAFQNEIHPAVISWGLGSGFLQEFGWVGTRDATPWLTAPDGIEFLQSLGLDDLRRYNHDLAWRAAKHLTGRWKTPLTIDESSVGCMVTIPAPASAGSTKPDAVRLRDRLLFEHNIEVHVHARENRVWIRVCAQAYNDDNDIDRLAEAVLG